MASKSLIPSTGIFTSIANITMLISRCFSVTVEVGRNTPSQLPKCENVDGQEISF